MSTGLKNKVLCSVASTGLKSVVLPTVFSTGRKNAFFFFFAEAKLFQGAKSRAKYPREIFKIPYGIESLCSCDSPAIM